MKPTVMAMAKLTKRNSTHHEEDFIVLTDVILAMPGRHAGCTSHCFHRYLVLASCGKERLSSLDHLLAVKFAHKKSIDL